MDWIKKLADIKSVLIENGFSNVVDEIINSQLVLGTSGEMYLSVMTVLMKLKDKHSDAYVLVKNDIEDLIVYGKSINYI
jgi:hypothetical protein